MQIIDTEKLTLDDLPSADADVHEIFRFALTINGYEIAGSFGDCADIANEPRHDTLEHLRMCLFFEQRRWRHFGVNPDGEDLAYIRELVVKMREWF